MFLWVQGTTRRADTIARALATITFSEQFNTCATADLSSITRGIGAKNAVLNGPYELGSQKLFTLDRSYAERLDPFVILSASTEMDAIFDPATKAPERYKGYFERKKYLEQERNKSAG
jgi:hypothetical protein